MCKLLVLMLVCHIDHSTILTDHVAIIEVNHFYDGKGKHVFDQVIFWDWGGSRFEVMDWRKFKTDLQFPRKNWRTGHYETIWHDDNILRRVTSDSFRETWTQYDPEVEDRKYLPKELRRGLRRPIKEK